MKRRDLLKATGAALVGTTLAGCGGASAGADTAAAPNVMTGKRFRWHLALFVPESWKIWGEGLKQFAADVKLVSGGRLEIKVDSKEVPAMQIFDAVKDGDVEMGHAAAYFWDGKAGDQLRASPFFTSIPFGMTAGGTYAWLLDGGGMDLWRELYADFDLIPLPLGNTGVQAGGWFRKPITSHADLANITMRIPGLGGKVFERAGGKVDILPGHEIATALETGRIDATEWIGPYHDTEVGFHKLAPYYYTGGWHEPGSVLELLINRTAWESLGPDLQLIVESCAARIDRLMFAQWSARDAQAYQALKQDSALTVAEYPIDVARALRPFADEVLAEVRASTPLAAKIHDSYKHFQQLYEAYHSVSEQAYLRSRTS